MSTSSSLPSSVTCNDVYTVSDAAGASALGSACPTFTGNIVIATDTTDSIALDGIKVITNDLYLINVTQITEISSKTLEMIEGGLGILNTLILSSFDFPLLTTINSIDLQGLPAAQNLSFFDTLQELSELYIQDTQINSLKGFNLQTIQAVTITNNPYLESLTLLPYNVTQSLTLEDNGLNFQVSMPNIVNAYDLTLRNCSSISMPSLTAVNGSVTLVDNTIPNFEGAPLLATIGGDLNISNNQQLTTITLPELTHIGGEFFVDNNPNLTELNQLDLLDKVGGNVSIMGNLSSVSLPALKDVEGSFVLKSSGNVSCQPFNQLSGVINGHYSCESSDSSFAANATQTPSTNSSSTSSPTAVNNSSGLSTGAKAGIGVGVSLGALLILLVVLAVWCLKRRKQSSQTRPVSRHEKDGDEWDNAAMLGNDGFKVEMEHPPVEMSAGVELHELFASHGESELGKSIGSKGLSG